MLVKVIERGGVLLSLGCARRCRGCLVAVLDELGGKEKEPRAGALSPTGGAGTCTCFHE